jgi:hypothetical protein
MFGVLADAEQCKEKLRAYIAGLTQEEFDALMRAETAGWSASKRRTGVPSRADLKDFEAALLNITPELFAGYPESEEHELLAHLFAALNERYMASRS